MQLCIHFSDIEFTDGYGDLLEKPGRLNPGKMRLTTVLSMYVGPVTLYYINVEAGIIR